MEPLGLLLVLAGGLAAAGLAWYRHAQKQRRRQELFALATARGLAYHRRDALGLGSLPFDFLRQGDDRGVENVVVGTLDGRPFRVFDLWVMHESTDSEGHTSRRYEHFTCAHAEVDGVHWPRLELRPENLLSRAAGAVGVRDVQFESDEFNREWQVRSDDRRFAYAFVDARMMQWLLMAGSDYRFEVRGRHVLAATKQVAATGFLTLHAVVMSFHDRIPAVAREWYAAEGGRLPQEDGAAQ